MLPRISLTILLVIEHQFFYGIPTSHVTLSEMFLFSYVLLVSSLLLGQKVRSGLCLIGKFSLVRSCFSSRGFHLCSPREVYINR